MVEWEESESNWRIFCCRWWWLEVLDIYGCEKLGKVFTLTLATSIPTIMPCKSEKQRFP